MSDIVNVVSVSLDEEIQCDVKEVSAQHLTALQLRNVFATVTTCTSITSPLVEMFLVEMIQVLRGKDAAGANRLLQNLAKASHILQLDGLEAVQVYYRSHSLFVGMVSFF